MADKYPEDLDSIPPEMLERARRAQENLRQQIEASPEGSSLRTLYAMVLSDQELAEWDAADPYTLSERLLRLKEFEERRQAEAVKLLERWPAMDEGECRLWQIALSRIDGLAHEIAEVLDWEHSPETYEKAVEARRKFFSITEPSEFDEFESFLDAWDRQQLVSAYADVVDCRRNILDGGSLRQSIERLTSAGTLLLRESPQKTRRDDARSAAAAGWEWLEEVRQEAFRRREQDLVKSPGKSRRQSILGMIDDIRVLYDERGKVRNVTLSSDAIQAFKTVEGWFIRAGRK